MDLAVGVVSYGGLRGPTAELSETLRARGAEVVVQSETSDVYVARNMLLTHMLWNQKQSVYLLLDDDNVISADDVDRFVDFDRADLANAPLRSAVYSTARGKLVAQTLPDYLAAQHNVLSDRWRRPRLPWSTGMGATAVQRDALWEVAQRVPMFTATRFGTSPKEYFYAFCTTKIIDQRWVGDDGSFCLLFGGAELDPSVPSGHHKRVMLWPDQETLDLLAKGGFPHQPLEEDT